MRRCVQCGHQGLVAGSAENSVRVGEQVFKAVLPAKTCPDCDEAYFGFEVLAEFEKNVAAELARQGQASGQAFAFMRKTLEIRAVDLAELLDVVPETISRWEHDKVPVDHTAIALLGSIVLESLEGREDTLNRLRAMREQRRLPAIVQLSWRPVPT